MVRAKFKVNKVELSVGSRRKKNPDGSYAKSEKGYEMNEACTLHTLTFNPVYGNGDPHHENSKFWDASPGGELKLNCVVPDVVQQFELGKEYYLDFTPADV